MSRRTLGESPRFFNALTVTQRENRALATQSAITDLAEILTVLTAQMRTSPGDFIVRIVLDFSSVPLAWELP